MYRDGELFAEYERDELTYLNPKYQAPKRSLHAAPMVIRDIGEYVSTLDGQHITSRSQHRDHMRAHDVVEVGNEKIGKMTAATQNAPVRVDRDLGEAIKRRVEEVASMPQRQYDEQVEKQAYQHLETVSETVNLVPAE